MFHIRMLTPNTTLLINKSVNWSPNYYKTARMFLQIFYTPFLLNKLTLNETAKYVSDLFISVSLMNGFATYSLNPLSLSGSRSLTRSRPACSNSYISFQVDRKCIHPNDLVSKFYFHAKLSYISSNFICKQMPIFKDPKSMHLPDMLKNTSQLFSIKLHISIIRTKLAYFPFI